MKWRQEKSTEMTDHPSDERPGRDDGHEDRREAHSSPKEGSDRRADFRVGDDQRSGHGSDTAWSRMSMLERRKRMWLRVRRDGDAPS